MTEFKEMLKAVIKNKRDDQTFKNEVRIFKDIGHSSPQIMMVFLFFHHLPTTILI